MDHTPVIPSLKLLPVRLFMGDGSDKNHKGSWLQPVEPIFLTDPEDVYLDYAARFLIRDALGGEIVERTVLRWPLVDGVKVDHVKFTELCYAQAEYFNAQLLHADRGWRVTAFETCQRAGAERIETQRYTIPLSFFETVGLGGTPQPYGMLTKPWFSRYK